MSKLKNNKKKVIIKSVKKHGFTLVELLGVIIILGVLALLIIPTIDKSLKAGKQKLYENQIENIELATNSWALDNLFALPENNDEYIIVELGQIKASGYIDTEIINPLTGELFPNDTQIKITKKGKKYVYEVVEGSGTEGNTDMPSMQVPIITLNGNKITNISLGGTYTELGATAKTSDGTDVSSNIEITGTVDTTTEGTYYIKYNITNNGHTAKEVVRTVNVIDKNPAINLLPNKTEGYSKAITVEVVATPAGKNTIRSLSYKVNGGEAKSVVGNKITLDQDGTYTLEVTAKDNEGNTTTITSETYKIDVTSPTITFAEGDAGIKLKGTEVASYDLKTGVTVTDNNTISINDVVISGDLSAVTGEYTVTYTLSDEAGNTVTKTRIITVENYWTFTEVMTNNSSVSSDDPDGNLRFDGSDPDNYVWFNNELWRIVGIFDGQVKIRRNITYHSTISFDETNGYNDWGQATLQNELNTTYLSSIKTNDIKSYNYIDLDHVWNIGGLASYSSATAAELYNAERSETISSVMTSHLWTGAIGLAYPSDYKYNGSWLRSSNSSSAHWTMTPNTSGTSGVLMVLPTGAINNASASGTTAATPVLYLKEKVIIVDGTGDSEDPYILGMKTIEGDILEKADPSELANNDPDGNLRYVGSTPNNYVQFNNELWRIIGVFNGQTKIIRNDYYRTSSQWDNNSDGSFSNDWSVSSLNTLYNNSNTGYIKTIKTNNPTSYNYIDLTYVWNLGGYDVSYQTAGTRSEFYTAERGTTVYSERPTTWTGAIGLMYPSDYGYSTSSISENCNKPMYDWNGYSDCYSNAWLYDSDHYQWTLTPLSDYSHIALYVDSDGHVSHGSPDYFVAYNYSSRPVLYLKSNVRIADGKGTDQEPYTLKMDEIDE